jgi:hypothetical protein
MTTTTANLTHEDLHHNLLFSIVAVWQQTSCQLADNHYQVAMYYFRRLQEAGEKPEDKYDGVMSAAWNYIQEWNRQRSVSSTLHWKYAW